MDKSETITELAAALALAQGEMPAVPMGSTNPFLKNRYANLGDVIKTAQPVLARHGLSYAQAVFTVDQAIGIETILMHKSGQWMSSRMALHPGDEKGISGAQAAGKTITYLRRYTLSAMLGVYADEDADGNDSTKQNGNEQPKQSAIPARQQNPAPAPVKPTVSDIDRDFPPLPPELPADDGNGIPLRYPPDKLREHFQKVASEYAKRGTAANDGQRKLCAAMLSNVAKDDTDRHLLQHYLTGRESFKDMESAEVLALLKWLEPTKDGDGKYWPNAMSAREATAVVTQVAIDNGQQTLLP